MQIGTAIPVDFYEMAATMGYDYVEFAGTQISSIEEEKFSELVKLVKKVGLPVKGFNAYCGKDVPIVGDGFNTHKIVEYAELMCQRGSELGIESIGIGSPMARVIPKDYDVDLADRQAVEFVKITAEIAKRYGIKVFFEAVHDHMCDYCHYTLHCKKIVDKVNMDNVGMILDFYHVEVMEENLEECVKVEGVKHLHINHLAQNYGREYVTRKDTMTLLKIKEALKNIEPLNTFTIEAEAQYFVENGKEGLEVMKEIFA